MAAANELFGVDTFLVGKLRADAALTTFVGTRVFTDLAPQGTAFPYVTLLFQSAIDRNAIPADRRIFTQVRYLIKAVTQEDGYAVAKQIADRIDRVLIGQEGDVPGEGIHVGCVYREEAVRYVEIDQGRRINHLGGRYRSQVSSI